MAVAQEGEESFCQSPQQPSAGAYIILVVANGAIRDATSWEKKKGRASEPRSVGRGCAKYELARVLWFDQFQNNLLQISTRASID
ncbi:hypothetical protein PG987_000554 [Apiospora arundinis]